MATVTVQVTLTLTFRDVPGEDSYDVEEEIERRMGNGNIEITALDTKEGMHPELEWEDYDTIRVEVGNVVITYHNGLEFTESKEKE